MFAFARMVAASIEEKVMRLNLVGILNRWGLAFILSFLILFPQPAYAHPDFPIADSVLQVSPGGFVEFPLSVHFHRVVGTFEVTSPAGGTITALSWMMTPSRGMLPDNPRHPSIPPTEPIGAS